MEDIQYRPFFCTRGLTIRELKEIVNKLPDSTQDGESFEVWIETGEGLSSPVTSVWSLNNRPDGCDIVLNHL
jgi:hypothetical protein